MNAAADGDGGAATEQKPRGPLTNGAPGAMSTEYDEYAAVGAYRASSAATNIATDTHGDVSSYVNQQQEQQGGAPRMHVQFCTS